MASLRVVELMELAQRLAAERLVASPPSVASQVAVELHPREPEPPGTESSPTAEPPAQRAVVPELAVSVSERTGLAPASLAAAEAPWGRRRSEVRTRCSLPPAARS